ncbi:E3 ubiquitin-protein ligase RMA1H1-like [Typha latifolia]|uniref:E3 ubiquitin-protein ligase RMA1H1-like n=1 Tax=Typha latifolia TaxID=4733 RepID=UPI003C2CD761
MVSEEREVKKCSAWDEATISNGSSSNGCFDCNICFDFAVEPVVTLCGHLYCWPCIYKWLHQQQQQNQQQQQCPVCKASLSRDALVPLYGRGGQSAAKSNQSLGIPSRPLVHREGIQYRADDEQRANGRPPTRHTRYGGGGGVSLDHPMETRVIHSTAGGVLGEMAVAVLPWVLGNQVPTSMYYTSPYYVAGNGGSPRLRRQEMEVERSLHQIWFFLFVFALLCLLLF